MRRSIFITLLFSLFSYSFSFATSGFFGGPNATFIVYDIGAGNVFTDSDATTSGAPIDIGTPTSFILNGGEGKTFKNGGDDITGVRIMYRIYPTGTPTGAFTPINLFFFENCNVGASSFPSGGPCGNAGDQKWQTTGHNVDVLAGLNPSTNYTLEFYFEADFTYPGGGGIHYYSNFGNNFAMTFATQAAPTGGPGSPSVPTMSEWALIILALLVNAFAVLFITTPVSQLSGGQTLSVKTSIQNLPFDKESFLKIVPLVAFFMVFLFTLAIILFGYELTSADPFGTLLSIPIIAYTLMLIKKPYK